MLNFRRVFKFKIISLTVGLSLFLNSTVYGAMLSERKHLRVPLSVEPERFEEGMESIVLDMARINELIEGLKKGDVEFVFNSLNKEPYLVGEFIAKLQYLWLELEDREEELEKLYFDTSKLFTGLIIEALNKREKKDRINLGIVCALNKGRSVMGNMFVSCLKGERVWLNVKSAGLTAIPKPINIFRTFPYMKDLLSNIVPADSLEKILKEIGFSKKIRGKSISWTRAPIVVDETFIKTSDIIFVADIYVLKEILYVYPEARAKVFLFRHLSKVPKFYGQNMEDPLAEKEEVKIKDIIVKIEHLAENLMLILDREWAMENGFSSEEKEVKEMKEAKDMQTSI